MEVINNIAAGLVVIDDLNQGKYYADVVLNHGPHAKDFKYNSIKKTNLLLGEKYTILRQWYNSGFNYSRHPLYQLQRTSTIAKEKCTR